MLAGFAWHGYRRIWQRLLIWSQCTDQKVMMIGQQVVAVSLCNWFDVLCIQIQKTVIVTFVAKNSLASDSATEDVIELASEKGLRCWHEFAVTSVEMINLAG